MFDVTVLLGESNFGFGTLLLCFCVSTSLVIVQIFPHCCIVVGFTHVHTLSVRAKNSPA